MTPERVFYITLFMPTRRCSVNQPTLRARGKWTLLKLDASILLDSLLWEPTIFVNWKHEKIIPQFTLKLPNGGEKLFYRRQKAS